MLQIVTNKLKELEYRRRVNHTFHMYSEISEERYNEERLCVDKELEDLNRIVEPNAMKKFRIDTTTSSNTAEFACQHGATLGCSHGVAYRVTALLIARDNTNALSAIVRNDALRFINRLDMLASAWLDRNTFFHDYWLQWLLSFDEQSLLVFKQCRSDTNLQFYRELPIVKKMMKRYDTWLEKLAGVGIVVCAFGGEEWTAGSWRIAQFMLHFKKT